MNAAAIMPALDRFELALVELETAVEELIDRNDLESDPPPASEDELEERC